MNFTPNITNGQFRERLRFVAYLLAVLAAVYQLPGMLARGWWSGPGNVTRTTVGALAEVVGGLVRLEALSAGFVLGLLLVLLVDEKKRLQALVLTIAVLGTLVKFVTIGFRPRLFVDGVLVHATAIGVGVGVAVVVTAGKTLRTAVDTNYSTDLEFRRAASLLTVLISAVVTVLYVEAHVTYPALEGGPANSLLSLTPVWTAFVLDTVAVAGFVVTLQRFMQYDNESMLLVLGPKAAGKTYFTVGAYLEEDYGGAATSSASRSLQELISRVHRKIQRHGGDRWHLASTDTGETDTVSFTRRAGSLLPKNMTVESLDHAGENLVGLSNVLDHEHLSVADLESGDLPNQCDIDDVQQLASRIEASDTLVLLLDGESVFGAEVATTDGGGQAAMSESEGDSEAPKDVYIPDTPGQRHGNAGLELYAPIIDAYGGDKRIVFAVTKADILESEMRDDYDLNIYDRQNLVEFGSILKAKLEDHAVARQLLRDAGSTHVYPVYFRTEPTEAGDRVPVRPDSGSLLVPFGYTRLLEDLS